MKKLISASVIFKKPWVYTVYETNNGDWYISVPYSPKSFVDTSMCIKLATEQKTKASEDQSWLDTFSDKIKNSYENYIHHATGSEFESQLRALAKKNRS